MKVELKWVAIVFVLHVLWHIGERVLGFYSDKIAYHEFSGTAFMLVYGLIMFLAIADIRSQNRGYLNRRHGFLSGLFISLVLVALAPLMIAILLFAIQPDFFDKLIIAATENGEYSVYEAAQQEYNYWSFVRLYMAGYLLVGALSAALWSFILHKMPEPVSD
jgi:hypothetical protein